MRQLGNLFKQNVQWSKDVTTADPGFFERLSKLQHPEYLWIGCSDSRVPANQIVGLDPGEVFVHRNVANLVVHSDLNCLSVIQFAVEVLKVKHVIVCRHYGSGGVAAALANKELGLIENWLRHIQDVRNKHVQVLETITEREARIDRLCELNVVDQVVNVCRTTIVRDAWRRGQDVSVHGWVYGLKDGLLRDLNMCITNVEEIEPSYETTILDTKHGIGRSFQGLADTTDSTGAATT